MKGKANVCISNVIRQEGKRSKTSLLEQQQSTKTVPAIRHVNGYPKNAQIQTLTHCCFFEEPLSTILG